MTAVHTRHDAAGRQWAEWLVGAEAFRGDLGDGDADVIRAGLADQPTVEELALALGMAARCRRDYTQPHAGQVTTDVAAGLLRTRDRLDDQWAAVCDAADERDDLLTDPSAVDRWAPDECTDRAGWRADRIRVLDNRLSLIAEEVLG